jgi:hypothetical protein
VSVAGQPEPEQVRTVRTPRARPVRRSTGAQIRGALSRPGTRRLAFLLHEVIGPPAALRDGRGDRLS